MKKTLNSLLFLLFMLLCSIWPSYAASSPIYLGSVGAAYISFSSIAYQVIVTGAASGTKVYGIMVTSTDTAAHAMTCQVLSVSGGTVGANVVLSIPASSGTIATNPAVNMLSYFVGGVQTDQNNNSFLSIPSGGVLQCNYATAISTGTLNIYAPYASY